MKRRSRSTGSMRSTGKMRLLSRASDVYQGSNGAMTLGLARRNYERYLARAREACDTVEMQNFCQHAEHYLRVMRANAPKEH
jgi:hypothetical protein